MASPAAIADAFETLLSAYPAANLRPGVVQTYAEYLEPFGDETLKAAVDSLIRSRRFFPSLQELLTDCLTIEKRLAEQDADLPTCGPETINGLAAARQRLQDAAYRGVFDPNAWDRLIGDYQDYGLKYGYAGTVEIRRRLEALCFSTAS